jgi:hypothetical protein
MDCDWWSLGVIMYEVSCVSIRETFKLSLVLQLYCAQQLWGSVRPPPCRFPHYH